MNESTLLFAALGSAVLALAFAWWRTQWINKQDPGTARMQEIGAAVREGAMAFLRREYKVLAIFVIVVAGLLAYLNVKVTGQKNLSLVALSFVVGALCSVRGMSFSPAPKEPPPAPRGRSPRPPSACPRSRIWASMWCTSRRFIPSGTSIAKVPTTP